MSSLPTTTRARGYLTFQGPLRAFTESEQRRAVPLPPRPPRFGSVVLDVRVGPHEPVVRGREGEDAGEPEQRIGLHGPEDAGLGDPDALRRQHVVRAQVAGRRVREVGGVELRIAPMREVGAALELRRLYRAGTGRRSRRVDPRVLE